jgi:predicted ester cyclase
LFAAFPDAQYEIQRTIAAEELVVQEWCFSGRLTGQLEVGPVAGTFPPNGRSVRLRGVTIYEVQGANITRETVYLDNTNCAVELGLAVCTKRRYRTARSAS